MDSWEKDPAPLGKLSVATDENPGILCPLVSCISIRTGTLSPPTFGSELRNRAILAVACIVISFVDLIVSSTIASMDRFQALLDHTTTGICDSIRSCIMLDFFSPLESTMYPPATLILILWRFGLIGLPSLSRSLIIAMVVLPFTRAEEMGTILT